MKRGKPLIVRNVAEFEAAMARSPEPAHRIDDELARVERRHASDPPSLFPFLVRAGRLALTVVLSVAALVLRYGPASLLLFPVFGALVFVVAFLHARWGRRRERRRVERLVGRRRTTR